MSCSPENNCTNSSKSTDSPQSNGSDPVTRNLPSVHLIRIPDWLIELAGTEASTASRHISILTNKRLKHLDLRKAQIRKKRHRGPNQAKRLFQRPNSPPIQPIVHSQLNDVTSTLSNTKCLPTYDKITLEDCLNHIGNSIEPFYVFQQLFRILINAISIVHQRIHKYELLSERRLLTTRERNQEARHYYELANLNNQLMRARKMSAKKLESKDSPNGTDFLKGNINGSTNDFSTKLSHDSENGPPCLPSEILNGDDHIDLGFEEESSIEQQTCWTSFGDMYKNPCNPSMLSLPLVRRTNSMIEPWLGQIFSTESDLEAAELDSTGKKLSWKYNNLENFVFQETGFNNVQHGLLLKNRENGRANLWQAETNTTFSSNFSQDSSVQNLLYRESLNGLNDGEICKTTSTVSKAEASPENDLTKVTKRIISTPESPCPLYKASIHLIRLPEDVIKSSPIDAKKASRRVKMLEGRKLKHLNLLRAQIRKKRNRAKRSTKPNHPENSQASSDTPIEYLMKNLPPYSMMTVSDCVKCIGNTSEPAKVFDKLFKILELATSNVYKSLDNFKEIRSKRSLTLEEMRDETRHHREVANLNDQMIAAREMYDEFLKNSDKDKSMEEPSYICLSPDPIIINVSSPAMDSSPP